MVEEVNNVGKVSNIEASNEQELNNTLHQAGGKKRR